MKANGGGASMRARRVFGLLLAALAALILRAGYLQVVLGDEYAERARRQHFKRVSLPPTRGRILDRHGRPLAACYHSCSVVVDPVAVRDVPAFAARLALLLGEPEASPSIADEIEAKRARRQRFHYARRWVDREIADRIRAAGLAGVELREEPRREYPHGNAAAAVIGAVTDHQGRLKGLTGLERECEIPLRGEAGSCLVFKTARAVPLHIFPETEREPLAGRDVHTTLDVAIQQITEQALDRLQERFTPKRCAAVVIDPTNGEILAMAGRPGVDLHNRDPKGLHVPAVEDTYEPGSTIKPLIASWALTRGAVDAGRIFDCGPGWKRFGWRVLHDVKANGPLDLEGILIKSSNIGIAQVGQELGLDELHSILTQLGFGRRTGVELRGEPRGSLAPRHEWKENEHDVSVSMGHGFAVTPLQLAVAYSALLNGGWRVHPTLLRESERPEPVRVPFARNARAFALATMEKVVAEGTGRRARIEGLRVGGKTGTSEGYGADKGKYDSSFVGFAPVDDPRLLVVVVAHHPKRADGLRPYGGVVAAPAVKEILQRGYPLLDCIETRPLTGSGVRHSCSKLGKVRVAAVQDSSVLAGERISPVVGRNPDSVSGQICRSDR